MRSELDYFLGDKLNEECGVFGVFNVEEAALLTYYGLHALQHELIFDTYTVSQCLSNSEKYLTVLY
jgi:hypothetical protein